jgi:hypothetical protein
MMKITTTTVLLLAVLGTTPALAADQPVAQNKPADNMQILRAKIEADRKLVVAVNMGLTESEAKGFWPIYESYQKDLGQLNQRIVTLIKGYAADYNAGTLTDDKAKKMLDEFLSIEDAEVKLKKSYVTKLSKVLPSKKVARYMQIENKIRAIAKYGLADQIPLVP